MKKKPILAVETTQLCSKYKNSGVALYTKHILRGLHTQNGLKAVCFAKEIAEECMSELPVGTEFYIARDRPFIWRNSALQHLHDKWGCKLAWFPFQISPWLPCMPFVVTIHDYGFLRLNRVGMSLKSRLYLSICLGNALLKAKTALSISEATTRGVVKHFPWAAKKVVTAKHGLPDDVRVLSETTGLNNFSRPKNLTRCVFLAGDNERKRFDLALMACDRLIETTSLELVVTGDENKIKDHAQKILGFVPQFLRCVGSLSRQELLQLYQRSHVLLYLSYFEGFGFPILEALALGAQVICLPGEAEKEIGGKFVGYANPASAASVEEKLREIITHHRIKVYDQSSAVYARSFQWQPSLEAHAKALNL